MLMRWGWGRYDAMEAGCLCTDTLVADTNRHNIE